MECAHRIDKIAVVEYGGQMKMTIELSDSLLSQAKQRAKAESVTVEALIERSLTTTLAEPVDECRVDPITFDGNGLSPEFEDADWSQIREAIV